MTDQQWDRLKLFGSLLDLSASAVADAILGYVCQCFKQTTTEELRKQLAPLQEFVNKDAN